jgi:membrane-bound inhibitor of C-type lysozyme
MHRETGYSLASRTANQSDHIMVKTTSSVFIAAVMLGGCGGGGWTPWSKSAADTTGPYTPPGAKGYACEGRKRLLVRFEGDSKSAWVIYPDREVRLNRAVAASGEQFSNARTTLTIKDGEAVLEEAGAVQFARCKPEGAP